MQLGDKYTLTKYFENHGAVNLQFSFWPNLQF